MSLHDRIENLATKDRHLEDWSNTRVAWLAGFDAGLYEACQLATEADELMAEMADVIKAFYSWSLHKGAGEAAALIGDVLEKHKTYLERNNEQ